MWFWKKVTIFSEHIKNWEAPNFSEITVHSKILKPLQVVGTFLLHVGETLRSICEALMRLIRWKALSNAAHDEDLGIEAIRLAPRLKKTAHFYHDEDT